MTTAERWNVNPSQFWLRGEQPAQPVSFNAETGTWNVYGYREVQELLADTTTFSSNTRQHFPEAAEFNEGDITQLDPPRHTKLRKLISQAFTPRVVAGLEPRIRTIATELLDAADPDRIDLVSEFAYPLPVIVIAELLGIPSSDRDLFRQWVDTMLSRSSEPSLRERDEEQKQEIEEAMSQIREMTAYLGEHAAGRRTDPRDDLLTKLAEAEVDGVRLTDREVVNFATVLLIAGHITTTMLVGNTILCLDAHPSEQERVRADRSLVPAAIEESLRMLSPFATLARNTTAETELGGQTIPANQLLMVWVAAANRDARHFTEPDAFSLTRDSKPHLSFGRGIHFCLGAPLARLEGEIAINLLLDRYPKLRTDPQDPPVFMPTPSMCGTKKLPLLLH